MNRQKLADFALEIFHDISGLEVGKFTGIRDEAKNVAVITYKMSSGYEIDLVEMTTGETVTYRADAISDVLSLMVR